MAKITGFPGMGDYRPPKPGPGYVWNANDRKWYKPKPKGGGGSKTPPPKAKTPEQWAEEQAEKRVQAEVEAIRGQQAAYLAEIQANAQRRIEQAQKLAAFMQAQGFDKRIADIYKGAAGDLGNIASGFAGETRALADADAAAQMNMLSGTGQEGAVRNEGTNMGDVLYGVGGWQPGKALGEQGAAYAANAALQPAFTMQYGAEDAGQMIAEGSAGLSDFAKMIAEAKLGKTTYKEELLETRRNAAQEQREWNLKLLESQRDEYWRQWAAAERAGDDKRAAKYLKLAEEREKRIQGYNAGYNADGSLRPGYTLAPDGVTVVPPGYRWKNGQLVKLYKPDSKDKPKDNTLTPSQQRAMIERIRGVQDELEGMVAQAVKNGEFHIATGPVSPKHRRALARKMFNEYKHLAEGTKGGAKALRVLIQKILDAAVKTGTATSASGGSSVWDS